MMESSYETIERGLGLYLELVREHAGLRREFTASLDQFFGGEVPPALAARGLESDGERSDGEEADLAARRHLEWFVLERPSEVLGTTPAEGLYERWCDRAQGGLCDHAGTFLGSHPSIFEVTGVAPGQGVWVRDLAGIGEYPLDEPDGSNALETGDVLVGRLFPVGDSVYRISRAAGVFRNPILREALRRDLARARASRRGVLRMEQRELERMFWGSATLSDNGLDPVAEARKLLRNGGMDAEETEELLGELASTPFEPERLVHGAGDTLGAILDRLAFDTSLDLEEARHVLMRAWCALTRSSTPDNGTLQPQAPRRAAQPADVDVDVASAIAEFDEKRAAGGDLVELFRELERRLAIDDGEGGAFDDAPDAPDFPGVVGAMIEELLWETEREHGTHAREELEVLRHFGSYAEPIGVFENLSARDLIVFATLWVPEQGRVEGADQARRLVTALRRFARWADEKHDLGIEHGFRSQAEGLASSLPRIVEANRRRTRTTEPGQGEVYELVALDSDTRGRIRDGGGGEHEVELDPLLTEWLAAGDLLRGRRLADGRFALYCCYPPESAALRAAVRPERNGEDA